MPIEKFENIIRENRTKHLLFFQIDCMLLSLFSGFKNYWIIWQKVRTKAENSSPSKVFIDERAKVSSNSFSGPTSSQEAPKLGFMTFCT